MRARERQRARVYVRTRARVCACGNMHKREKTISAALAKYIDAVLYGGICNSLTSKSPELNDSDDLFFPFCSIKPCTHSLSASVTRDEGKRKNKNKKAPVMIEIRKRRQQEPFKD